MSLIVSRSSPLSGSVSAANERRWISIRCGTSRGCGRREKLLRVTGAAWDRANWATPQGGRKGRIRAARFASKGKKTRDARRYHKGISAGKRRRVRGALRRHAQSIYLSSTLPPASSISDLSLSASSRSMPSLTGFGASSTSAFASLRPRPVAARTALITWIFLSPAAVSTTSTVADSSAASAPSPAGAPAAGAAAATAVAETPNSSSSALMRSDSSSTEMPLSSSIQSSVLVAMGLVPPGLRVVCLGRGVVRALGGRVGRGGRGGLLRVLIRGGRRLAAVLLL